MKEAEEDWGKGQTEEGKRQKPSRVILNRNMDPQKIAAFGAFLIREASKQSRWGLGGCKKIFGECSAPLSNTSPTGESGPGNVLHGKGRKGIKFWSVCRVFWS